ncbi:hypothetical protein FRX31_032561 [Thalictrum thalictroides]|uniref:Uncharacterized protein n=1 Tax=Thalictrum thalictroides TaxID=46969 RepID=A0A7J6UYW3_THATH|nr:hypothetical protein FRX31_032561 [Thalictrum thalictroides]
MTDLSNNVIKSETIYDPIMEPLVQSSLANFLYLKRMSTDNKLPDIKEFHPNYVRYQFLDHLMDNKASVTLGSLKLFEFQPGTSSMDISKLMVKVDSLLVNPILKNLVTSYIMKLQVGGDQIDRILGSLNSAVLGFTDKKTVLKLNEILQLPIVLTAWGLTAKVRSCNRGGKILRPWHGKLYISTEGLLKWERPESIIDK